MIFCEGFFYMYFCTMKIMKSIFKFIGILFLLFLIYVVVMIGYGMATDYQPESIVQLESTKHSDDLVIEDSTLSSSGDRMVISPEEAVKKNISGGANFLKSKPTDFYLLQEVDMESKRSYYINQYDAFSKNLEGYNAVFSKNFDVAHIPIPVFEPWNSYGTALSGLGTFSKYKPLKSTRYDLPGKFHFPDYLFQLDRCAAVHRFDLESQKELIVINIHNSAYDKGGNMKKKQMAFLKELIIKEYEKGNYVIAGGDWNQCPPGFEFDTFKKLDIKKESFFNISADYLPEEWQWVYDPTTPTSRSLKTTYKKGETFIGLIDFFLVSPNIEILEVKGQNMDYEYSDHQPVRMEVKLK